MTTLTFNIYPFAPLQKNNTDLEQIFEKNSNDVKRFFVSNINIKEMITSFKDRNQKSKQKYKKESYSQY